MFRGLLSPIVALKTQQPNVRKFKVALNPHEQNFLNFAKSCILSWLSKFYNKKKFHRAVFKIEALQAKVKGAFSRS